MDATGDMLPDTISPDTLIAFQKRHGYSSEEIRKALQFLADDGLRLGTEWRCQPVGIRQFIEDPHFLDNRGEVYPEVMKVLEALATGQFVEAVMTGGIGTAKTTIALWATAYQLYLLSCMTTPHRVFDLTRSSEIVIIFQSITRELAKGVDYQRFRSMIEQAPYFRRHFPFDRDIESELRFPGRIIVKPVAGTETAAIGQNVIGGVIDELNFFQLVDKSRRSHDGSTYDQAVAVYNSISRRRKSRFLKKGKLPGILFLVSSSRYPDDFTSRKIKEAGRDPTIFVYNKRTWDIKPGAFSGETFRLFIGDDARNPRILSEGDHADESLIMDIPVEYLREFETDITNALRDIAGVSTQAVHPFLVNREAVSACFGKHPSILSRDAVAWPDEQVNMCLSQLHEPGRKRWAHVDLSLSNDSTGVVIGCVTGFVRIDRGGTQEVLPRIRIDCALEVRPPRGGEISFDKIRTMFYKLRERGLNLKWISFDSYQSADSIQILRQKGFQVGQRSMDKTTAPYDVLKTALYDGRVDLPNHPKLMKELLSLEFDAKRGKIDHPAHAGGSKDLSDALAGVVYGLTMRTEIWVEHGIPLTIVPASVRELAAKSKDAQT